MQYKARDLLQTPPLYFEASLSHAGLIAGALSALLINPGGAKPKAGTRNST